jgi:hypothetical protein
MNVQNDDSMTCRNVSERIRKVNSEILTQKRQGRQSGFMLSAVAGDSRADSKEYADGRCGGGEDESDIIVAI